MLIVPHDKIPMNASVYIHATDTCYGFACKFDDKEGIELIQKLKGRDASKPISLLFGSLHMLHNFCEVSKEQEDFMLSRNKPASFLLKKKPILKDFFPEQECIVARVENFAFPVGLSTYLGTPVTTTSVNKSGHPEMYSPQEIERTFKGIDSSIVLVDSGHIREVPPSNIWDLTKEEYVKIRNTHEPTV